MDQLAINKAIIKRFNKDVIEDGNVDTFNQLMHSEFVNRTAPANANGSDSMWHIFTNILKTAFPDLTVIIYDQVAEEDKVTTRKTINGTHSGTLMGIETNRQKNYN